MAKVGRLTKDVLEGSMMNAYEAGFAKAVLCLTADECFSVGALEDLQKKCWEEWGQFGIGDYDPRETKELAKTSSRGRGRPVGSKSPPKPEEGEHLCRLPYDQEKCRARFWNQGFGGQCWRDPMNGDDLCKGCAGRRDNDEKDFWGYFDEPLGSDAEHKKSGGSHPWKVLQEERAAKKDSDKKEKQADKKKALKEKALAKKASAEAKKKAEAEKKAAEEEAAKEEAEAAKREAEAAAKEEAEVAAKKEAEQEEEAGEKEVAKGAEEDGERIEIIQGENAAGEEIEVEIHHHSPRDDEDTQSLDGDNNDYKDEEPKGIFEEWEEEGCVLKWNKETNELFDPDDDELMGMMVQKDGTWVAEIKTE